MQKISPFLWFNDQAEDAAKFYTSLFSNSKIGFVRRFGDAGPGPKGKVMTLTFQLEGLTVMALNGGPQFTFTPAVSLFVSCPVERDVDALWKKLSDRGNVLMDLQKYPFSEKFGWVSDRYGLSWQLNLTHSPMKISPFFLFVGKQAGKAEEAIKTWGSLFKGSSVEQVERYSDGQGEIAGSVMHARFTLEGQAFMAMDSNREHAFSFNPAISFFVDCRTQEEVDELWEKLSAGGKKGQCGWLEDRYGVSWQIVPSALGELLGDPDPARSRRAMQAMLKMNKLDIRELQEAASG